MKRGQRKLDDLFEVDRLRTVVGFQSCAVRIVSGEGGCKRSKKATILLGKEATVSKFVKKLKQKNVRSRQHDELDARFIRSTSKN